jgi:hypothetical protein
LPGANALAYLASSKEKSFVTLTPGQAEAEDEAVEEGQNHHLGCIRPKPPQFLTKRPLVSTSVKLFLFLR